MEKRALGAILVLCVGFLGVVCTGAQFPIRVASIAVEGNEEIRDAKILDVIGFEVGDVVGESEIKSASQAVYDLGWFSEVVPRVGEDGSVTFRVAENAVIEDIEISGNVNEKTYKLFGVTLFKARIMTTSRVRGILRDNGVKKGAILHLPSLQAALKKVLEKYDDIGYVLVMIGDVKPGPTLKIEIIEGRLEGSIVQGLSTVPEDAVLDVIDLPVGEPLLKKDLQRVMAALRRSVYVDSIDVKPLEGAERDSFFLQWTVTERNVVSSPVQFQEIALDGVTEFPQQVALRALGPIPEEGPIDNYGVLRILEPLHALYYDAGFIMVRFSLGRIDGQVLHFKVDEGRVSKITIAEGTVTQERVVLRNLALHAGRVLTLNDLKVSYQSLNSLGYFETVAIDPVWGDDGVHVPIQVTDKSSLGGLNGSVAVDPHTGSLVGELSINQRNLFGTGQDISAGYKRGLTSEGEPESSTWHLGYSTVAYFSGFNRVKADLYRTVTGVTEDGGDKQYLTLGGSASFTYPVADYTDLALSYAHEQVREIALETWTPVESITVSLFEDSTDDPYAPNRGTKRSVSIEKAGGFAVGQEYTKVDLSWVQFFPLYGDFFAGMDRTFGVRVRVGLGTEDLAATQAYEFGGVSTVRGFDGQAADRILIANFEHRLELTEGLILTSFFDWGADLARIRPDEILSSTGCELGIMVAGIYFRLDVVWVLGEEAGWMPRFDFGFGPMF